jgi:hypothetical protein
MAARGRGLELGPDRCARYDPNTSRVPALHGTGSQVCLASQALSIHCCQLSERGATHLVVTQRYVLFMTPWNYFKAAILHIHVVDSHKESDMIDSTSMIIRAALVSSELRDRNVRNSRGIDMGIKSSRSTSLFIVNLDISPM